MFSKVALLLIWLYRKLFSPFVGRSCRFYPSCSAYAEEAFKKRGFWPALGLTLKRLFRSGPLPRGGYDPVDKED